MKFSIITPSYNQGRYIRDCIESVRTQTGVEWEHIVTDAGSTDETLTALREFPHLQWTSEKDKGMSDGINKGFLRATGDWLMWLNTDDYLLPGALAKVAAFAEKHPEADVIYGGWNFVDGNRRTLKVMKVFPFDLNMVIHYGPYIGSTACFFRRETTILQGYLLDIHFRCVMDGEYYARLGRAGKKFIYFPAILAGFRVHETNTSMKYIKDKSAQGILHRYGQFAEGATIRRLYGLTVFHEPMLDGMVDGVIWCLYQIKKVLLKLFHGSYWTNTK